MFNDFSITQHDTSPQLVIQLVDDAGLPITKTLAGASFQFHMMSDAGTVLISAGVGSLIDNTAKTVGYVWQPTDTATYSNPRSPHLAEMQVTYADATIETFPNDGFIKIHVKKEIA